MSVKLPQDLPAERIRLVAASYGARHVRVFGSRTRGDAMAGSDLDLLVEFEPGRSLLDAIGLEQELGDLLNYPVQVVTPAGLSPFLRERVLAEAVVL